MEWWHWLALGLVLVALEMAAAGGFYVIFFGIAAIAISGLRLIDTAGPLWTQLLLFSVLSVASLMLFRSPLRRWLNLEGGAPDVDTLVGEIGTAMDDLAPGAVGRVELRGTVWTARNAGTAPIGARQRCAVIRTDKLTLFVKPEEAAS
jgi:membrane protein implicated in regulation of membrane protease activity